MNAQRFMLGYAFTWDDLVGFARDRARLSGTRQKVTRDGDSWLIVSMPDVTSLPERGRP